MKAITLKAQWGLPLLAGAKWIETRPRNVRHRGRTAVHLSKAQTEFWRIWHAGHQRAYTDEARITSAIGRLELAVDDIEGIFGCVAGSVEVTDCVPILPAGRIDEGRVPGLVETGFVVVEFTGFSRRAAYYRPGIPQGERSVDVTDQLPFGVFEPGRYAVITRSPAVCFDRCPYCWGAGHDPEADGAVTVGPMPVTAETIADVAQAVRQAKRELAPCPVCKTAGTCDPVPARGQQAVPWNWTPETST